MIQALKSFIDRTTMYRLVLYYLLVLFVAALAASVAGVLSFSPLALLWSALILLVWSWMANELFAWTFDAVTNTESVYITALILLLILPPASFSNVSSSIALAVIASWAVASKYILAFGNKHVFNPAALAVALSAFVLNISATWWVAGNLALLPFIAVGGVLLVHKLRKADLMLAFGITVVVAVVATSTNISSGLQGLILHSTVFFFAFVMLTEPLTMPPTRALRVAYAVLIGILFTPATHIGTFYFTPELALIIGNVCAALMSPKGRLMLTFIERRNLASGMFEYVFKSDRTMRFKPGQYLEWTLGNVPVDNRGNRRYFTIASAPEESTVALGVRFYDKPSAFKQTLADLPVGAVLSASSLAGDFTLPKNTNKKLAFLAGGIGVTPFVSMARHCIKTGENRDAVLLYSCKTASEVAYQDVFTDVAREGWRTVYVLSNETAPPTGVRSGFIDAPLITQEIPDYLDRVFYISGPPGMVEAMKKTLIGLGVSRFHIKTDFFPGLA